MRLDLEDLTEEPLLVARQVGEDGAGAEDVLDQPLALDALHDPVDVLVVDLLELALTELEEDAVRRGAHGGEARASRQERDLAEELPLLHLRNDAHLALSRAPDDLDRAARDREEGVAGAPLLHDRLARAHVADAELREERAEGIPWKEAEERNGLGGRLVHEHRRTRFARVPSPHPLLPSSQPVSVRARRAHGWRVHAAAGGRH